MFGAKLLLSARLLLPFDPIAGGVDDGTTLLLAAAAAEAADGDLDLVNANACVCNKMREKKKMNS